MLLAACLTPASASAQVVESPPSAADLRLMVGTPADEASRVTLGNWQYGPYNRWAFQHVRELIPTVAVARGDGPIRALPKRPEKIDALSLAVDGARYSLVDALGATYTDGFLVLHRGAVVYERYFNGLTDDQPHLLWSVSKSISGLLAGILAGDGTIDLARPVQDYVPELADSGWAGNSVRTVLDMQTTSNWIEDYDDPASSVRRQDASNGLLPMPELFAGLPRGNYFFLPTIGRSDARAGTFIYKSGDTDVAAWAMERAADERLADLLSKRLWSRIGAEHDAYYTVDPSGSVLASGGLNATLRDIARVGQLVLDGGTVGERQIVPADWIRDIFAERNAAAWRAGPYGDEPGGYRSFWWHRADANGAVYAHGVHGQWIYVDREAQVVIAKLSSHPDPVSQSGERLTLAAFDTIVHALDSSTER